MKIIRDVVILTGWGAAAFLAIAGLSFPLRMFSIERDLARAVLLVVFFVVLFGGYGWTIRRFS